MSVMTDAPATVTQQRPLGALWVEITGKCQLSCVHCYAGSSPDGTHGTMSPEDWERVIGEAAALGTRVVCIIGGEPTVHPQLPRLVRYALDCGMTVEVYSNLVSVRPVLWHLFEAPGVRLATSWYTSDRAEHKQITGRDTWRQTLRNIEEAVRREIPLRVGLIDGILPGQHAAEGAELLRARGVGNIGTDYLREFGRGTKADPSQACGNCGNGRAAVLPDGSTVPCPMTRWMVAGNVLETSLADTLDAVTETASTLPNWLGKKGSPDTGRVRDACNPDDCRPDVYCAPLCSPSACRPRIS